MLTLTNLSANFGDIFSYLYGKLSELNPITKCLKERQRRQKLAKRNLKARHSMSTYKSSLNRDDSINQSELDHALYVLSDLNASYELDFSCDEEEDNDSDDEEEYEKKNGVPVFLAVFIILAYLYAGSYLFQRLENWQFSESIYFIFITLSSVVSLIALNDNLKH